MTATTLTVHRKKGLKEALLLLPWYLCNMALVAGKLLFLYKRASIVEFFRNESKICEEKLKPEDEAFINRVGHYINRYSCHVPPCCIFTQRMRIYELGQFSAGLGTAALAALQNWIEPTKGVFLSYLFCDSDTEFSVLAVALSMAAQVLWVAEFCVGLVLLHGLPIGLVTGMDRTFQVVQAELGERLDNFVSVAGSDYPVKPKVRPRKTTWGAEKITESEAKHFIKYIIIRSFTVSTGRT